MAGVCVIVPVWGVVKSRVFVDLSGGVDCGRLMCDWFRSGCEKCSVGIGGKSDVSFKWY